MADEIEAMAVFNQFGVDQGSGNVKVMVAARDLAWSTPERSEAFGSCCSLACASCVSKARWK